jgi:hypothetical protein
MRLDGNGVLTLEDARTWIEETGLCLFLPRRQFSASVAPSFVEAVVGKHDPVPDPKHIALAEELLVRLETDGVAVRLNLLGLPGEAPDFVVASWVLPYVYALRGDRDWRRSPQLTGSRQVSQLAVQAYKLLEAGETTIPKLTHALGREVTEGAVLRAITELWQQLRIIPIITAPGETAQWQLLRLRFQKAIAEGASTSQVTAISVLASIYLQAVIAASMEEVELFLAPLTARSKVREVLRGLVATRQVHTLSMGHAPHFYVAGTLPEFVVAPTIYASASTPAFAYFMRSHDHDDEIAEPAAAMPSTPAVEQSSPVVPTPPVSQQKAAEVHAPRAAAPHKPIPSGKSAIARPHFSRPAPHSRDRKPAQSASSRPPVRRSASDSRPAGVRSTSSARPAAPSNGNRNHSSSAPANGNRSNGNGRPASRPANGVVKSSAPAWSQRKATNGSKPAGKTNGTAPHKVSAPRAASLARPARPVGGRKPAVASSKAGGSKRFGFAARPKPAAKKRG